MSDKIKSSINIDSSTFKNNSEQFLELINRYESEQDEIKLGGGSISIQKQHDKGRMTARERIGDQNAEK